MVPPGCFQSPCPRCQPGSQTIHCALWLPFPPKKVIFRKPGVTDALSPTVANAAFCLCGFKDGERAPAGLSPTLAPFLPQIPLVPLSPALSIVLNIYLMLKLSYMTWLRFAIWLLLGECSSGSMTSGGPCLLQGGRNRAHPSKSQPLRQLFSLLMGL